MYFFCISFIFDSLLRYWHRKTPSRDFRIILPLYFSFTQKSAPERSLHRDASAQMSRNESLDSSSGNILNVNSYDSDIMSGADDELPISETGAGAVTLGTLNKKETKRREEDVVSKIIFFFPFFIRRETALTGVIYGSPLLILPPLFIKTWDKKTGDFTTRVSLRHPHILSYPLLLTLPFPRSLPASFLSMTSPSCGHCTLMRRRELLT